MPGIGLRRLLKLDQVGLRVLIADKEGVGENRATVILVPVINEERLFNFDPFGNMQKYTGAHHRDVKRLKLLRAEFR